MWYATHAEEVPFMIWKLGKVRDFTFLDCQEKMEERERDWKRKVKAIIVLVIFHNNVD